MKLELRTPITCTKEEVLLCFQVNPAESRSIEPDREKFLGDLLKEIILPAGKYLFVQCRTAAALGQEEWLDMAIEQQKDGLWERHKPGDLLYIRHLYEDGAFVTQIFRPIT